MTTTMTQSDASIRKAAVLVRSLDAESVAALLARLSPTEAKAVRMAVRELDAVTEDEQRQVAQALKTAGQQPTEVLPATAPQPDWADPLHEPSNGEANPLLKQINQADPETLVACLSMEQPATVAVVLSCLRPEQAAEVLSQLPVDVQSSAVDRLADMGEIDPESLEVIAAELEVWISRHAQNKRRRQDRVATLQAILSASPSATRNRLTKQLSTRMPELRPQEFAAPSTRSMTLDIKPPQRPALPAEPAPPLKSVEATQPPVPPQPVARRIPFTVLETLPTAQLAEVLHKVDRQSLMLALVGASDKLMTRLRSISSRKQFKAIEKSLGMIGPIRLGDIAHAQDLVAIAAGEVVASHGGRA